MAYIHKEFRWEIIESALQEPNIGSFLIAIHANAYEELWGRLGDNSARVYVSPEMAKKIMGVAMKQYGLDAGMPLVNWGFGGDETLSDNQMKVKI